MTVAASCSELSRVAGEPLAGTATVARRWLLVETPGRWERDVASTALPEPFADAAETFDGRVQLIRRPDRRPGSSVAGAPDASAAFLAETAERGGALRRIDSLGPATTAGEPVGGTLVLVCCHGRRDPCCARAGAAVFDAMAACLPAGLLWQTSHLGGHRFAANVLALPSGVLLGRVAAEEAAAVAGELAAGRIPLGHYRGRTFHAPHVQAADAAVRRAHGLVALDDVRLVADTGTSVRLRTPAGAVDVDVERVDGPPVVESCGKDPVPSVRYSVRW